MRRKVFLSSFLALALVASSMATALAKEGIVARLDAPLPGRAQPGTAVTIGWTISVPGGGSLVGTNTILRVYSRDAQTSVDAPPREDRPGHFLATFRVPTGGIATVGIGIPGTSCLANVCQPAVEWFTVEDPAGAPLAAPNVIGPPDTATEPVIGERGNPSGAPLLVGLVAIFVALAIAGRMRRA